MAAQYSTRPGLTPGLTFPARIDSRIYFSGKVFTAEFVFDTRIPCRIEFFIRIYYMNYFLCEKSILMNFGRMDFLEKSILMNCSRIDFPKR